MKKRNYLLIAILVLILSATLMPVTAIADGHGGGFHGGGGWHGGGAWHGGGWHDGRRGGFRGGIWIGPGWGPWWGWGDPWWGYPYYYPYYPYYQPPVVQQQPQSYIQQDSGQEDDANNYWYFCPKPQGYYPYIKQCPGGWLKVVPAPPAEQRR